MVFVIVHTPWPILKGLDHPVVTSMLASMLYAYVSLFSSRLCHIDTLGGFMAVWFHLTPMRLCLNVTTRDASSWCQLLHAYLSIFCSVWWYACDACLCHPLAFYAFLYSYLYVHAWILLVSVSSMLQHNEVMDIRSKTTFVPHGHHLLCVYLLSRLFACHAYHVYSLYAFSYPLCIFSFYRLFICFLSLPLHECT